MWPADDGGTGQILGCFGGLGAIIGTVIGVVVGVLTDNAALKAVDDLLVLLAIPVAAWGVGLLCAAAWDAAVKRATRLGSPIQDLRGPGQSVTAVIAGIAPAIAAIWLMLVAPSLATWVALVVIAASFAGPAFAVVRWAWDVVR